MQTKRILAANMGSVIEALMEVDMGYKGIDAVVHLAAIPSPGQTNSSEQFRINTMACAIFPTSLADSVG